MLEDDGIKEIWKKINNEINQKMSWFKREKIHFWLKQKN